MIIVSVDGVAKEQGSVWRGIRAVYAGEIDYVWILCYYHDIKSLSHSAAFLGTHPPLGPRVTINTALLVGAFPLRVVHPDDLDSDTLASHLFSPGAFA